MSSSMLLHSSYLSKAIQFEAKINHPGGCESLLHTALGKIIKMNVFSPFLTHFHYYIKIFTSMYWISYFD